MPETSLISLATNNVAEYSLVDLVTDKNGISHEGVLHYNKTANGANSSIIFGLTSYAEGAEKIVFTADYMAGAAGSGGLEFYVDGKFVFEASGIAAAEEWSKLTVIITPEGEGIAVELYVNGVLKKSGAVAVSFDAANKMTVRWWKSSVAGMYLDSVSFRQIAKEEKPSV